MFDHVRAHPPVLLTPAIIGLLTVLQFFAYFRNRLALPDEDIGLSEFGHDLWATKIAHK